MTRPRKTFVWALAIVFAAERLEGERDPRMVLDLLDAVADILRHCPA
jgi:hypothetical protein